MQITELITDNSCMLKMSVMKTKIMAFSVVDFVSAEDKTVFEDKLL